MIQFAIVVWLAQSASGAERSVGANELIKEIAVSGRTMAAGETAAERLADPRRKVAPGQPPLLSFRYFEGAARHRFGKLDLMLDDAGH